MKIIFLDFDGVITTVKSRWMIDPHKCKMIKTICDATDAKIVISSSWRRGNLEKTIEEITNEEIVYGNQPFTIPERVVGVTNRMYSCKYGVADERYGVCRGVEIGRYIIEHPDITNYVILDDDMDMLLTQKDNFIQTDGYDGISDKDVIKAIEILNKK